MACETGVYPGGVQGGSNEHPFLERVPPAWYVDMESKSDIVTLTKTFVTELWGHVTCTLKYYKCYHHSHFGPCYGHMHDKEMLWLCRVWTGSMDMFAVVKTHMTKVFVKRTILLLQCGTSRARTCGYSASGAIVSNSGACTPLQMDLYGPMYSTN